MWSPLQQHVRLSQSHPIFTYADFWIRLIKLVQITTREQHIFISVSTREKSIALSQLPGLPIETLSCPRIHYIYVLHGQTSKIMNI